MRRTNISFYILIFFALAVNSIIGALLYKASPIFDSKPVFLCQRFISNIMVEIPRSLPSALLLISGVVLGIGLLSFLVQLFKTRIFLNKMLLGKTSMPSNLTKILENLSLADKVILIKDKNIFSFCYGILSPFIVVSTGLVKSLTTEELEAVLLHEQSHLISRDPTKVLIGKTLSSMFFFLPIFKELHKNIEAVSELLADQWTVNYQKTPASLKSALKKILASSQLNIVTASNAAGADYFEIRVHRLIDPGIKHKFRLSIVSLSTTFLFVLISWFLLQTPVSASHMDTKSNSTYFLCSENQSCSKQCHHNIQKPASYAPTFISIEKKWCSEDVHHY